MGHGTALIVSTLVEIGQQYGVDRRNDLKRLDRRMRGGWKKTHGMHTYTILA